MTCENTLHFLDFSGGRSGVKNDYGEAVEISSNALAAHNTSSACGSDMLFEDKEMRFILKHTDTSSHITGTYRFLRNTHPTATVTCMHKKRYIHIGLALQRNGGIPLMPPSRAKNRSSM